MLIKFSKFRKRLSDKQKSLYAKTSSVIVNRAVFISVAGKFADMVKKRDGLYRLALWKTQWLKGIKPFRKSRWSLHL